MKFEEAIEHILSKEGGYVNNPNDSGGETKFGISKRSYPKVDIKNLTREGAIVIYKRDYWDALKADSLPVKFNLHVFDFAVNAGVVTAIKIIQGLAGSKKDGVIGVFTLRAVQDLNVWDIAAGRARHYAGVVRDKPKNIEFLFGWMLRTLQVTEICLVA